MGTDTDISTLNTLIKTTLDSVKGFEEARKDSDSGRFNSFFSECAQDRRQVVNRLQEEVRRLGGNPEDDSSVAGAAHRTFLNLKQAVTGSDDKAVIEEVERGEDYLKEKYETALRDVDLSPQTRAVIEQAFTSVRAGHDTARSLKQSFENHY